MAEITLLGFLSHEAMPVTQIEDNKRSSSIKLLQCNAGSLLLTGCSPAEPASSSTTCVQS